MWDGGSETEYLSLLSELSGSTFDLVFCEGGEGHVKMISQEGQPRPFNTTLQTQSVPEFVLLTTSTALLATWRSDCLTWRGLTQS